MKKLDITKLIEKYPRAKGFLINEVRNNIEQMQQQMLNDIDVEDRNSAEIPQISDEEVLMFLNAIAESNLQLLIYMLDSKNIHIVPIYLLFGDWTGSIYSRDIHEYEGTNILSSRTEVIIYLFPKALEILENKLKEEENE